MEDCVLGHCLQISVNHVKHSLVGSVLSLVSISLLELAQEKSMYNIT